MAWLLAAFLSGAISAFTFKAWAGPAGIQVRPDRLAPNRWYRIILRTRPGVPSASGARDLAQMTAEQDARLLGFSGPIAVLPYAAQDGTWIVVVAGQYLRQGAAVPLPASEQVYTTILSVEEVNPPPAGAVTAIVPQSTAVAPDPFGPRAPLATQGEDEGSHG
jgi:hypothetical protein